MFGKITEALSSSDDTETSTNQSEIRKLEERKVELSKKVWKVTKSFESLLEKMDEANAEIIEKKYAKQAQNRLAILNQLERELFEIEVEITDLRYDLD